MLPQELTIQWFNWCLFIQQGLMTQIIATLSPIISVLVQYFSDCIIRFWDIEAFEHLTKRSNDQSSVFMVFIKKFVINILSPFYPFIYLESLSLYLVYNIIWPLLRLCFIHRQFQFAFISFTASKCSFEYFAVHSIKYVSYISNILCTIYTIWRTHFIAFYLFPSNYYCCTILTHSLFSFLSHSRSQI